MKYTLPNGAVVEGTQDQIVAIAKVMGHTPNFRGFYNSETHGLIEISTMNVGHMRNALLKKYRAWVESLSAETDNHNLLQAIRRGPTTDTELVDLLTEFARKTI